ncbi:unnamed protein product, partial [Ilex paraguariensis]
KAYRTFGVFLDLFSFFQAIALMEAILDIQEFPLIIAVAFSGLAIALAGLSLWYLREYVSYSKKRASNLPPLP